MWCLLNNFPRIRLAPTVCSHRFAPNGDFHRSRRLATGGLVTTHLYRPGHALPTPRLDSGKRVYWSSHVRRCYSGQHGRVSSRGSSSRVRRRRLSIFPKFGAALIYTTDVSPPLRAKQRQTSHALDRPPTWTCDGANRWRYINVGGWLLTDRIQLYSDHQHQVVADEILFCGVELFAKKYVSVEIEPNYTSVHVILFFYRSPLSKIISFFLFICSTPTERTNIIHDVEFPL